MKNDALTRLIVLVIILSSIVASLQTFGLIVLFGN